MIIADTDVLIDALRGREPIRSQIESALRSKTLATTTITVFELLIGAKSLKEETNIETLLRAIVHCELDFDSAKAAANLSRKLQKKGHSIATADALIAGICIRRGAALFTRNRRHFEPIEGLTLVSFG